MFCPPLFFPPRFFPYNDGESPETRLRQTPSVIFLAIDSFLSARGKALAGLDEFSAALDHAGIPMVWVSRKSRAQLDEHVRALGHSHPFLGEDGCGVYLPEGYFHLRPDAETIRLGRFTCIPVAKILPAASEGLESLSEETGVSVVPLRSLSPRELAQNLNLPERQAELVRHRDFEELFFFAGASDQDQQRFRQAAAAQKMQVRDWGEIRSLAVGADLSRCVRQISKLYDRALRSHPVTLALDTPEGSGELFRACDRRLLLTNGAAGSSSSEKTRQISLSEPNGWEQVLAAASTKS